MKEKKDADDLMERIRIIEEENEKLRRKELELIELNTAKNKFLSIISHDLKNPITTIIGLCDMLEKNIEKNNFNSVTEYSKNIKQSTHRIKSLLFNLFEWSISQSGKMEFNPVKTNLRPILKEVIELTEQMIKQKSISVEVHCIENDYVFIDKEMISTVLRNILSNAIKFSYPGGKINIKCEAHEQNIELYISDNGVGMPPKVINSLFKIGETISICGTENESGTGIGLLLSKEFLEKHNSTLSVESFVGKGSTFKFSLPVVQPQFESALV